ncbi:beta-phosphoglucomutase [Metabacillus sp. GX 13764]|uniref:beta-phosphoglucomutase n=1 Tax=Metabacillus kandeliae TaxID=2900151 RepID=UPI001E3B2F59|nr:beta-phosphoglucomutase [Metabacillus kandeliae]MCD7036527.1 beta-phosphoglucomutase [Metabacillus kandeliae]
MMGKIEAFIFDLDGVITDTAEYHYLAWKGLAEEIGITFTKEDNEQLKGISRMESLELILKLGGREKDFSQEEKEQLAAKKNEHYVKLIETITPADILPGIEPLLEEIKKHGLKLGLASVSKNAFAVMESLGLKEEFDVIVDAAKIQKGKPDPEIFLTAAKLLNVEASACIGVEDAAAGVDSIKGAGMFAVGVGSEETLHKADVVYTGTELLSYDGILKEFTER